MHEDIRTLRSSDAIGSGPVDAPYAAGQRGVRCSDCAAWPRCLRYVTALDRALSERTASTCFLHLDARQWLCREGEPFSSLYIVRTGSLKTVTTGQNGKAHVLGIHLPGEVAGIDGIALGRRTNSLVALEATDVCAFSYGALAELARDVPAVQRWLLQVIGRQMAEGGATASLLRSATAEGRVAEFLLNLSRRVSLSGGRCSEFRLSASRGEIAVHLGLTRETVCRVFAKFHRQRLLDGDQHRVRLCNPERLASLAAGGQETRPPIRDARRPPTIRPVLAIVRE